MEQQGKVVIPQQAVSQSDEKKRRHQTLRQTMIYRDAANLKYMVATIMMATPRKLSKYLDCTIVTAGEAKKCIAVALCTREVAVRTDNLDFARVLVEDVADDMVTLRLLKVISKDMENKMKRLARKVAQQCVALRDYSKSQGESMSNS